jgi:hypothetical protein
MKFILIIFRRTDRRAYITPASEGCAIPISGSFLKSDVAGYVRQARFLPARTAFRDAFQVSMLRSSRLAKFYRPQHIGNKEGFSNNI